MDPTISSLNMFLLWADYNNPQIKILNVNFNLKSKYVL